MDEFSPLDRIPMSHDETTKIEPTLIVKDAPPIASAQPDLVGPFKPESEAKSEAKPEIAGEPKIEAPIAAAAPETPKIEEPKIEPPKLELSASQAPPLPPAPQLAPVVALKQPEPVAAQ